MAGCCLQWQLTLTLDDAAGLAEALAALLADDLGGAARFVELGFCENPIAANAAAKPSGKWLLVGEAAASMGRNERGNAPIEANLRVIATDPDMALGVLSQPLRAAGYPIGAGPE